MISLTRVTELVNDLMVNNKLGHDFKKSGWTFKFSNTKAFGDCAFGRFTREIRISKKYLNGGSTEESVIDTILHELAHAYDFETTGRSCHGHNWRQIIAKLGGTVSRCGDVDDYSKVVAKYYLVLPKADGTVEIVSHSDTMKKSFRNPQTTWIRNRKAETYGHLEVMTREQMLAATGDKPEAKSAVKKPAVKKIVNVKVKAKTPTNSGIIVTPLGNFKSLYSAAKAHGSYYSVIKNRVESTRNTEYFMK